MFNSKCGKIQQNDWGLIGMLIDRISMLLVENFNTRPV